MFSRFSPDWRLQLVRQSRHNLEVTIENVRRIGFEFAPARFLGSDGANPIRAIRARRRF
jgi:hypothetical protein